MLSHKAKRGDKYEGYNYTLQDGKVVLRGDKNQTWLERCLMLVVQNKANLVEAEKLPDGSYKVWSASGDTQYDVQWNENVTAWTCNCQYGCRHDLDLQDHPCSHWVAARFNPDDYLPGYSQLEPQLMMEFE